MRSAVLDRLGREAIAIRTVHRLQEEMAEVETGVALGLTAFLAVHELQFVAPRDNELCVRLGADADPVDPRGYGQRAVRLDGDLEVVPVQRVDQRRVQLEQRL